MPSPTRKSAKNAPETLLRQAKTARRCLLVTLVFTISNLIMVLADRNTFFLVSASVPYYVPLFVKALENNFTQGAWVNGPHTLFALGFSFLMLTIYFLCWLFSDKHKGWLVTALVLFIADTLALLVITYLLYTSPLANLLDILFHVCAIVVLIQGIRANGKLQSLSPDIPGVEL